MELTEYERGFLDALYLYAWMKDGVMYVGSTGTTWKSAKENFLRKQGHTEEEITELSK